MGAASSVFGWFTRPRTGETDDPDPVTGLTSRDRYLVTSSWKVARTNPTETGAMVLIPYFEKHPEGLEFFPFRDVAIKDLMQNKRFQAHCNSVVYALSSFIDQLDDAELLIEIVKKIGTSHAHRKIPAQSFLDLKNNMLECFEARMPTATYNAWKKTLDLAFAEMIKGTQAV